MKEEARPRRYLFYCSERKTDGQKKILDNGKTPYGEEFLFYLWRPSYTRIVPQGLPVMPFAVWWLFHMAHIFKNRGYGIGLIYHGKELVHRSCIFPKYFRFPFMTEDDLQIGDTWTSPRYRGHGLATRAVREIVSQVSARRFWYVVESDNLPSIRVIEKVGFRKIGEGVRTKPLGINLIGRYVITKRF